jgi:hypothetical protein
VTIQLEGSLKTTPAYSGLVPGKGLNQFDRSTERFIHYTVKNGLPSNSVWGILEEDASLDGEGGNLWLSTLFISPQTVKKHLNNIYGKLSVSGRRQAVEKAQMLGILPRR